MLISLNWISDFIKLNKSPEAIADKITLSLSEVEKIERVGNDTVLEIENKALTHRPDCFSVVGLAREIAAYFNIPINDPFQKLGNTKIKTPPKKLSLSVSVKNPRDIPRYCTIVLSSIKVKNSPEFIQKRLISCGVRPINNVVDITNYVMLELGQPLHAYNYDKVHDKKIIVRKAKKGETIVTLDGITRNLDETMVVIADNKRALLLGGVMGGKDSEVSQNTKTIILESATFDGKTTRITSKKVELRTDGSTRYEKNIDPHLAYAGIVRAIDLLEKYAEAKVASKLFDIHQGLPNPKVVNTTVNRLNTILGLNLKPNDIKKLLERLKLKTEIKDKLLTITVPTYRRDLNIEADIAEEVARIYGYDNIPTTLPKGVISPPPLNNSLYWEQNTKLFLKGVGFTEVNLPEFVGKEILDLTKEENSKYLKLINPMAPDKTHLRRSLLQGLLMASKNNLRYFKEFNIFEIGRVFLKKDKNKQPTEIKTLSAIMVNKSFYEIKGIIEALFEFWKITLPVESLPTSSIFLPKVSAKIGDFGVFGELNSTIKNFLDYQNPVLAFELNFDKVISFAKKDTFYKQILQNPPLIEDFSFEFEKLPLIGHLIDTIKSVDLLINNIEIVGTYENTITVRIYFQDPQKSLSSQDVNPLRRKLIENVRKMFKGKIRIKEIK